MRERGAGKKLKEAAAHWARGGAPNDDLAKELEFLGAPDEYKKAVLANQQPDVFEVYEENRPALEVFLRVSTQWHVAEGVVRGLNYQSLKWVIDMYAPDRSRDLFEAVSIMEGAALEVLNQNAG